MLLRLWRRPSGLLPRFRHFRAPYPSRRKLSHMASSQHPSPLPSSSHPQRLTASSKDPDPHNYTTGRWLNRDSSELQSRHIAFDFPALCERAIHLCPGATRITKYAKKEGGFNRVFIFSMDTGPRVVARIPTRIAGPARLGTHSEVATIRYLQKNTTLPIPTILDWNDDPSNPVGAEYIIQTHVPGIQLHQAWPHMTSEQHMLCTKALALKMKEMAGLEFPVYGSIYFSKGVGESYSVVTLGEEQGEGEGEGFCIGPSCSRGSWVFGDGDPREGKVDGGRSSQYGPWNDLASYCQGLIETGLSRLPKHNPEEDETLPHQGSVQDHIRLLNICREVLRMLIKDKRIQDAATPVLLHPDFHKRNIYVSEEDPTVITGLIDWQSASIEPAFIYANETPDFAALPQEYESSLFDSDSDSAAQAADQDLASPKALEHARKQKDALICHQTHDVCLKGLVPKLRPARLLDPTLFRLFHYAPSTWQDTATAIFQELMELSTRWTDLDLGPQGSCPFRPTEEDLKRHAREYEDFETVQRLKMLLRHALCTNSDGWVPAEEWDVAREVHRELYQKWIETAREAEATGEEEMTVDKAERLWPFDAR